jgi:hypothetical protein
MPTLEHAVARYAAIVRQAEFAAEAEGLADRAPSAPQIAPGVGVT